MPDFKTYTKLRLFRQLKVFLSLRFGVTRGQVPADTAPARGEIQRAHERLQVKDDKLKQRDREIKRLRSQLKGRKNTAPPSQSTSSLDTPAFFVVGRGKSGTSWLMRILDAHPDILCRGEGRFFGLDWKRDDLKGEQVGVPPRSLYGAMQESEYLRYWIERSVWSREGNADEHLAGVTRAATEYFMQQKLAETGKSIVGDKTPLLTPDFVREISEVYPDAKVIHIIRDGRDVTVSAVHHQWNKSTDQGGILRMTPDAAKRRESYRQDPASTGILSESNLRGRARAWRDFVGRAVEDGPATLGDNYTEVRYEGLLEQPEEETRRLLEFLGAEADEKTVNGCVQKTSFEKLSRGRKPGEEDSTSFFRKGIAGDWKNVFTDRDREIFNEEAGDLLVKLGYEK